MEFVVTLVVTAIACVCLRRPLKRFPAAFYAVGAVLDVILLAGLTGGLPLWARGAFSVAMQRGNLGMALFFVVMFIGVLPRDGSFARSIRSVRAELSILACILVMGHMVFYLRSYVPRLVAGSVLKGNVVASFCIAIVLLVLVAVLGVTSLRAVKRRMSARSWRRLQSAAYAFYALVYVHVLLMLGPSAAHGGTSAIASVVVYTALFCAYAALRVRRAVLDRRSRVDLAQTVADQGFTQ